MPELPDVTVYIRRLQALVAGQELETVQLRSPFLLRTADPPISAVFGATVVEFSRMGKRIVFHFDNDHYLVLHLMIAGRLRWREKQKTGKMGKVDSARFLFSRGTLHLTEAGSKKRASLFCIKGREQLARFDAGGLEVLEATYENFRTRLLEENHTLKRALTDPRIFSGIGNAYSDEILHRARLSPVKQTSRLREEEIRRLYKACREVLRWWIDHLDTEAGDGFPQKVTAFRPEMAVHGKYGQPCPDCGATVQRIRYAANETNYCPNCQTGGRLLADRALSRLLKKDWPRSPEELEERLGRKPGPQ